MGWLGMGGSGKGGKEEAKDKQQKTVDKAGKIADKGGIGSMFKQKFVQSVKEHSGFDLSEKGEPGDEPWSRFRRPDIWDVNK